MSLDIRPGTGYRIEGVEYVFDAEDDGHFFFRKRADNRLLIKQENELILDLDQKRAIEIVKGKTRPLPPFREDDEDLRKIRAKAFYARRWDEFQPPKTVKSLERFLRQIRKEADAEGFEPISPGTLCRILRNCGTVHNRPLSAFQPKARKKAGRQSKLIESCIERMIAYFYEKRARTQLDAFSYFMTLYWSELPTTEVERAPPLTTEALRLRLKRAGTYENISKKFGEVVAKSRFRGVGLGLQAHFALEVVIIDGTPVDVWVVDHVSGAPLGRPHLMIAIDVHSRMIVGFHISFEGANLGAIMGCTREILRPKLNYRERYTLVQRDNDGWGKPTAIVVDNGLENVGKSYRDGLGGLGIDVRFTPVRTPEAKAIGERIFHTLNTKLFHRLPGGVPYKPDIMKKLGIDPQLGAVLSLHDLEQLTALAIVESYNYEVHETLGQQPALVWEKSIQRTKRPFIADMEEVETILSAYGEASLTRSGIKFRNHIFHDQIVTSRLMRDLSIGKQTRSQPKGHLSSRRVTVKFKWDPSDASSIMVWNPKALPSPRYEILPNRDARYAEGLPFAAADQIRAYAQAESLAFVSEEDRWKARNYVRQILEDVSSLLTRRDRIRSLPIVDGLRSEHAPVIEAIAPATPDGRAQGVACSIAETARDDDGRTAPGRRRGGKAATLKAMKSRRQGPHPGVEEAKAILTKSKKSQWNRDPAPLKCNPVPSSRPATTTLPDETADLLASLDWENG